MRISKFLKTTTVKLLLFIYKNEKVRYKDLSNIVNSRGSLSNSLKYLISDGLVIRKVDADKIPIESYYFLSEKGKKIAFHLEAVIDLLDIF